MYIEDVKECKFEIKCWSFTSSQVLLYKQHLQSHKILWQGKVKKLQKQILTKDKMDGRLENWPSFYNKKAKKWLRIYRVGVLKSLSGQSLWLNPFKMCIWRHKYRWVIIMGVLFLNLKVFPLKCFSDVIKWLTFLRREGSYRVD